MFRLREVRLGSPGASGWIDARMLTWSQAIGLARFSFLALAGIGIYGSCGRFTLLRLDPAEVLGRLDTLAGYGR